MTAVLSAFVPGPVPPKGSSTLRWIGQRDHIAAVQAQMKRFNVRCFVVPQNENDLKKWQRHARDLIIGNVAPQVLADGVEVRLTFRVSRPPSSKRVHPSTRPDVDKCVRTVLDMLGDGFTMLDDGQVVALDVVKRWTRTGESAGVEIEVLDASGQAGLV